jgi:hypothetical protein
MWSFKKKKVGCIKTDKLALNSSGIWVPVDKYGNPIVSTEIEKKRKV